MEVTTLTPTGCLGCGFDEAALKRGMTMNPDVIAVDAGSTDPGPHCLGSNANLISDISILREMRSILAAASAAKVPVIVGSAGGAGTQVQVDHLADLCAQVVSELGIGPKKIARIYAEIPKQSISSAIRENRIDRFEADFDLTESGVNDSVNIVAQMGPEPIMAALDGGADIVIAGRACDDTAIAAYSLLKGANPGLSIHMGKIMECGAFSAVPFAMDVMVGRVAGDSFILEPGSANRRASLTSVAAHTLYEREDPIIHEGPGYRLDLSDCNFATVGDRQVQVTGSRYHKSDDYWLKLEGARSMGFRTISIGGVRCPIMVSRIDAILDAAKQRLRNYFTGQDFDVTFHVYGRDGVMKGMESRRGAPAHELGVVMEIMAPRQDLAHAICHKLSSDLLHAHFEGQKNTSGNLAFLYSPSDVDVGEAYAFSAYHLMKVRSATEFFPINYEIAK